MSYIVECASCHQPWEVATYLGSSFQRQVLIPAHAMLHPNTSKPLPWPCAGAAFSGIGMGDREDWEHGWKLDHPGRPVPVVLDGDPIRVLLNAD